jgi:TonB dependent receptor/TonB-dependent Receptor Plug Domain
VIAAVGLFCLLSLSQLPPDAGVAGDPDAEIAAEATDAGATDAGGAPGGDAAAPSPVVAPAPRLVVVKGVVLARGKRDPIFGAGLAVGTLAVGETDEAGRFAIELAPGKHRLQVQAPGFQLREVEIDTAQAKPLTIRLNPRASGERYQTIVSAPGGGVAISGEDLISTPGSLGEPFRVIESLPGVSQVAWPLSLYSVRGANPGNTGFFIDGVRLPALFHLGLGPAVIHPYFLEKLDFYPGGYPARYGRFVSGIVAATTAPPPTDRMRGSVDLRLYDAGAIIATPINGGKGTLTLGGRYSFTGLIFSLLSPTYTLSYWDYQARFDHQLGGGRFTAFAFGSHDHLGHKEFAETDAQIDFHRLDLRWSTPLGPGRLQVGTALGADRSSVSLDPVVKLPVNIRTKSVAPRASYLAIGKHYEAEAGVDAEVLWLNPNSAREDARGQALFQDRMAAAAGGYLSMTWRPIERLEITPAMRYDLFFEGDAERYEPGPRLLVRFRPFAETWLKAQVGRYAQTASLPVAVPGFESFGLAAIGTQTSKQGSVGVEQAFGDALSFDVSGFYQRLKLTDLLSVFNYDPQDPRLLELRDGESYGVEVMIRRPPSHRFYGWLAYTWSKSLRLIGPSRSKAYSDWDQRHVLNLVAGVRLPAGFGLGARFHLNTGRPYPVFDDDNPAPPDYIRLPTFYQLDLRARKRFVFDNFELEVYVEAVNATLTKQVFDVKRINGEEDRRYYQIVLPSLGLHAEW